MSWISGVCANRKLLVDVAISGDGKKYHRLIAKIDTGANITAMGENLLERVKCPWHALHTINTANGYVEANSYRAIIGLFTGDKAPQTRSIKIVAMPFRGSDFDILLGMDVLANCCFVCRNEKFFLGFDGADKTTLQAAAAFLGG